MTHVSYSNIGKRAINQDYIYPIDDKTDSNLFMVCDGVGSSPFGEVASKEVCEAADRFFTERSYTRLSDINFDALADYLRESSSGRGYTSGGQRNVHHNRIYILH